MATGSSTYDGLAMGLYGEYQLTGQDAANDIFTITGASSQSGDYFVIESSAGTELFYVEDDGRVRITPSLATSGAGLYVVSTLECASGVAVGFMSHATLSASDAALQRYAGWFYLDTATNDVSIGGGREAVLNLYYYTHTTTAAAGSGFVFFDDGGTNAQIAFNFGANTLTNGCVVTGAGDATATAGIRCMFGTNVYYILCATCLG